jgi:OmpA family protein
MNPRLPLAIAATLFVLPAAAQVSWYGGIAGGQARTDIAAVRGEEGNLQLVDALQTDFKDKDRAWKAFAGLRLNPAIALEVVYADLGRASTATHGLGGAQSLPFTVTIDRKVSGVGLDVVGSVALIPSRLDLLGKAGVYRTRLNATATLEGNVVFRTSAERRLTAERKEDTTHLGLGMQWWLARNYAIRAEYERFLGIGKAFGTEGTGQTGAADLDAAWLGIVARW